MRRGRGREGEGKYGRYEGKYGSGKGRWENWEMVKDFLLWKAGMGRWRQGFHKIYAKHYESYCQNKEDMRMSASKVQIINI